MNHSPIFAVVLNLFVFISSFIPTFEFGFTNEIIQTTPISKGQISIVDGMNSFDCHWSLINVRMRMQFPPRLQSMIGFHCVQSLFLKYDKTENEKNIQHVQFVRNFF